MVLVTFHPLAEREYRAARRWYAEQSPDAARGFREAVDQLLERVTSNPQIFPRWNRTQSRWGRTKRYPYVVIFRERGPDLIRVLAVAHASRRPGYWRRRR